MRIRLDAEQADGQESRHLRQSQVPLADVECAALSEVRMSEDQFTSEISGMLSALGSLTARDVIAVESATCDRCGGSCEDGYRIEYHGQADPETGYRDQSIICIACDEEDGEYDAADAAMDMAEGF